MYYREASKYILPQTLPVTAVEAGPVPEALIPKDVLSVAAFGEEIVGWKHIEQYPRSLRKQTS